MGTISSSVGLISGINTGQIITALINADAVPITQLQSRVSANSALNTVYGGIQTQLTSLQTAMKSFELPSTFTAASANSSDASVLTATASNGAAVGSYSLQVARLVTTQQLIGAGFTDSTDAKVGAGTITLDAAVANLSSETPLAALNGGNGVGRGQFRITDRSGATAVIDTTSAVSLDDVVNKINNSTNISIRASVKGDKIVLLDSSGKTASNLIVQDLGTGTSAADLGIAGSIAAAKLTGTTINYLTRATTLSALNDGRGVGTNGSGNDFTINFRDGTSASVDLSTAKTLGDAVDAINAAAGSKLTASIPANGSGIKLVDNTSGTHALSVVSLGSSTAARDLGLTSGVSGNTLTGGRILSGIDTTLLSSLNGGTGLPTGRVTLTDRSGASTTVDLSGAVTVQDVLDSINNAGTIHITASLKSSGNGIQLTDTSGGSGNITVADSTGTAAAKLGIAGSFNATVGAVQGSNLHKQWLTQSTSTSALAGGNGLGKGSFTITNAAGASVAVDLSTTTPATVKDLLYQINSKGLAGVTASINAEGNGILLTDTSTGAGRLTVADNSGTVAKDLQLAGTTTGNTIDGAYEKSIAVTANDTLSTVQQAINAASFGVTASIISDGSATNPYHLSLTAKHSGTSGGVSFDSGATNLGTTDLVKAQDAAVFIGGANTGKPLLVTSTTNSVSNVIQGVTLNLNAVSSNPVTLSVTPNADALAKSLDTFVTTFNSLSTSITNQSQYNTSSNTGGILLGDSVATSVQSTIYNAINTVVTSGSKFRVLADVGITVGADAQLSFDEDKFRTAFGQDPAAVAALFDASTTTTAANGSSTSVNTGIGYAIDTAINGLTDPVAGSVAAAITELTTQSTSFNDQITQLNVLLDQKRSRLETEFANMETALASLQSQQTALSSFTGVKASSTSSSSSSSTG